MYIKYIRFKQLHEEKWIRKIKTQMTQKNFIISIKSIGLTSKKKICIAIQTAIIQSA